ncbi:MAG TPA: WGxxGxxG family protein [Candidatus Cybelea sp.]|jgi:hypothetical protein|nr:WGxxGxxG family protein [Candidatus Cybelea sp.]
MKHLTITALIALGVAFLPHAAQAQMDQATTVPTATANPLSTANPLESPNPLDSSSPVGNPTVPPEAQTIVTTSSPGNGGYWGLIGLLGLLGLMGLRNRP